MEILRSRRIGQNFLAELLLSEFRANLDVHLSPASFSVREQMLGSAFENDTPASYYALDDFLFRSSDSPRSLIFGLIERALFGFRLKSISTVGYTEKIKKPVIPILSGFVEDNLDAERTRISTFATLRKAGFPVYSKMQDAIYSIETYFEWAAKRSPDKKD